VEILVNGVSQKLMTFSAATTTLVAFPNVTVPLTREGPNEILTRLRYDGDEATAVNTVTVTRRRLRSPSPPGRPPTTRPTP